MGNVINYYTVYINNIIAAEESLAEFLRARDSFSIVGRIDPVECAKRAK